MHLPHGMSYPVSGMVKGYFESGYPGDHAMVPHGYSVVLNAPAVFRFTASANPQRHLEAAEALGANVSGVLPADAGKLISDRITWFIERLRLPNGLRALGYTSSDFPRWSKGYPSDHAMVPHGYSVVLNAPAVFRFTASANPQRHLEAAEALGANVSGVLPADAGKLISDRITWFIERLRLPNGLRALGYTSSDFPRWSKALYLSTASPNSRHARPELRSLPTSSKKPLWHFDRG